MYKIQRTEDEIDNLRNAVSKRLDRGGTKYGGMTYEQGVADTIAWIVGDSDDHPYPEDDDDE